MLMERDRGTAGNRFREYCRRLAALRARSCYKPVDALIDEL